MQAERSARRFTRPALRPTAEPHVITYHFVGDQAFAPAMATRTLSVRYGVCLLYDAGRAKEANSTYQFDLALCDALGQNAATGGEALGAIGVAPAPSMTPIDFDVAQAGPSGTAFVAQGAPPVFQYKLKSRGLAAGSYSLLFTVDDAPTVYAAPFILR
jgi:hypothetical protein